MAQQIRFKYFNGDSTHRFALDIDQNTAIFDMLKRRLADYGFAEDNENLYWIDSDEDPILIEGEDAVNEALALTHGKTIRLVSEARDDGFDFGFDDGEMERGRGKDKKSKHRARSLSRLSTSSDSSTSSSSSSSSTSSSSDCEKEEKKEKKKNGKRHRRHGEKKLKRLGRGRFMFRKERFQRPIMRCRRSHSWPPKGRPEDVQPHLEGNGFLDPRFRMHGWGRRFMDPRCHPCDWKTGKFGPVDGPHGWRKDFFAPPCFGRGIFGPHGKGGFFDPRFRPPPPFPPHHFQKHHHHGHGKRHGFPGMGNMRGPPCPPPCSPPFPAPDFQAPSPFPPPPPHHVPFHHPPPFPHHSPPFPRHHGFGRFPGPFSP